MCRTDVVSIIVKENSVEFMNNFHRERNKKLSLIPAIYFIASSCQNSNDNSSSHVDDTTWESASGPHYTK